MVYPVNTRMLRQAGLFGLAPRVEPRVSGMDEGLEGLLRRVAEALYYVGFEAKPQTVNITRVQELYYEVEEILKKGREG